MVAGKSDPFLLIFIFTIFEESVGSAENINLYKPAIMEQVAKHYDVINIMLLRILSYCFNGVENIP
jgi:hypothetical protein